MGKYRNFAPAQYQQKETKEVVSSVFLKPCCVCGKVISIGYYGRWEEGGTCSKKCEIVQEHKSEERYHGNKIPSS